MINRKMDESLLVDLFSKEISKLSDNDSGFAMLEQNLNMDYTLSRQRNFRDNTAIDRRTTKGKKTLQLYNSVYKPL
jgi:hypothetical protein